MQRVVNTGEAPSVKVVNDSVHACVELRTDQKCFDCCFTCLSVEEAYLLAQQLTKAADELARILDWDTGEQEAHIDRHGS